MTLRNEIIESHRLHPEKLKHVPELEVLQLEVVGTLLGSPKLSEGQWKQREGVVFGCISVVNCGRNPEGTVIVAER